MKESLVKLEGITKSYDGQMILDDLNLDIYQNSFVTLLGPSGCGKTTTLRIIGGFETPDKGKVIFDGQDITSLPPHKRALNTVFQTSRNPFQTSLPAHSAHSCAPAGSAAHPADHFS